MISSLIRNLIGWRSRAPGGAIPLVFYVLLLVIVAAGISAGNFAEAKESIDASADRTSAFAGSEFSPSPLAESHLTDSIFAESEFNSTKLAQHNPSASGTPPLFSLPSPTPSPSAAAPLPSPTPFASPTPDPVAEAARAKKAMEVVEPETLLGAGYPFVPRKIDYSLELGWMGAHRDALWVGGQIGTHVGRCILTASETCQQYLDFIAGAGVREAESYGLFLGSARWQYVNFPDRASTFVRVFGGGGHVSREGLNIWRPAIGAGIGVTTYLHRNVDVRIELRSGAVDRAFIQAIGAVQIKADNLLEYFAMKLKEIGAGTARTVIEATGTVIDATGEGIGAAVDVVTPDSKNSSGKKSGVKKSPENSSSPKPTPRPARKQ